ncbi:MAG: FHA domain-containing protein [Vulcanimicrobiota bacterium]
MTDASTLGISFAQSTFLAEPAYDLVVNGQVFALDKALVSLGSLTRLPCNDVALERLADLQATLMIKDGTVIFRNIASAQPALKAGQTFALGPWEEGQTVELAGYSMQLRRHQPGLARFELYSEPWRGRFYHLYDGEVLVGRPGKRSNHIFLDDPTVSRAHARMHWQDGKLWLQAETDVSPTCVNGRVVQGAQVLNSGDLLQFGKQIGRLRYSQLESNELSAEEMTLLHVDVNNYAQLLENGADDQLVREISELYERCSESVEQAGGRLAAYSGESIIGIFPSSQLANAERAARVLLQGCDESQLEVSCGLFTGPVSLARVGFHHGHEVTPVGAGAEQAARLQAEAYARRVGLMLCPESQKRLQA